MNNTIVVQGFLKKGTKEEGDKLLKTPVEHKSVKGIAYYILQFGHLHEPNEELHFVNQAPRLYYVFADKDEYLFNMIKKKEVVTGTKIKGEIATIPIEPYEGKGGKIFTRITLVIFYNHPEERDVVIEVALANIGRKRRQEVLPTAKVPTIIPASTSSKKTAKEEEVEEDEPVLND